jgi:hypothetical protein
MAEFQAYLEPLIARRGTDPGLDLISLLLRRRPRRSTSASSSARA